MKPPFRHISILLIAALVILFACLCITIFYTEPPKPQCGGSVVPPEWECGNAIQELKIRESMDSLSYGKYLAGHQLFKEARCPSCHNLDTKKVGPPLRGISHRRDSLWIRKAIVNFDKLIAQEDSEALQLSNEYGNMQMPQHEFLSKEDLDKIVFYLDKGRDD